MGPSVERSLYRFSVDEFHKLIDIGLFANERVELVRGRVLKMVPHTPSHASAITNAADALRAALAGSFVIRVQLPVTLPAGSEPEPDIAVVRGKRSDYASRHPGAPDVAFAVEVAETSLSFDRDTKGPVYAEAGIPEYWIVNLQQRVLEVYRRPEKIGDEFAYAQLTIFQAHESVAPFAAPNASVLVADLLP